jgi:hypothetical protein
MSTTTDEHENREQHKTEWSCTSGEPPEWYELEKIADDGFVELELNDFRSFFDDDPDEDIATRVWGAVLYTREQRFNGPDDMLWDATRDRPHRALYGVCAENACALRETFERRGFQTRCLSVMADQDIDNLLGGTKPDTVRESSYRHYIVQTRVPVGEDEFSEWITCDVAQYETRYECFPYVGPDMLDRYTTFEDSIEVGEAVLGDRDATYCTGTVKECQYKN